MRRATTGNLLDRQQALLAARQEAEAEVARLQREEEFLGRQIREAHSQLRHYEGLLAQLRREWGGTLSLRKSLRRLD